MKIVELKEEYLKKLQIINDACDLTNITLAGTEVLNELINKSTYDIAFIGEFSTGKSTLINCFLGSEILPTNLTPTTAKVTYISYSEAPYIILKFSDDRVEKKEFSKNVLKDLSASNPKLINEISSIELFYPLDVLKDGIRLIDTPGTNDIEKIRVDLTYKILPEVECISYVTIYPITESNLNVFKSHIVDNGIKNLFIILNKLDLLEMSESELIIEEVKTYFDEAADTEIELFAVSAYEYFKGASEGRANLIKKSKMEPLIQRISKFITTGERYKNSRAQWDCKINKLVQQADSLIRIKMASFVLPEDKFIKEKDAIKNKLDSYIKEAKELSKDVQNSFDKLNNRIDESLNKLIADTLQTIDLSFSQPGSDPNYLIKSIELTIKNKYEAWRNQNNEPILQYVETINKEVSHRLGEVLNKMNNSLIKYTSNIPNVDKKNSLASTTTQIDDKKASIVLSVASVGSYVAMATAGITLAPLAMLIMPLGLWYLNSIKKGELEKVKSEILDGLQNKSMQFRISVLAEMNINKENILSNIDDLVENYSFTIKEQLSNVENERQLLKNNLEEIIGKYETALKMLENIN